MIPRIITAILTLCSCLFTYNLTFCQVSLDEAKSLFKSGEYEKSREIFEKYLIRHPDDPESLYYLGRTETDGLLSYDRFRRLLEVSPRHELADDALFQIAESYYSGPYYITARSHFRRLLEAYPKSELADRAQYRIGMTFLATKDWALARAEFGRLLTLYPDSKMRIFAGSGIMDSYFVQEDLERVVEFGERLLQREDVETLKSHILWTLVQSYRKIGREEDASKALERIAHECPNSYEAASIPGIATAKGGVPSGSEGDFAVQIGAFKNASNATTLYNRLSEKGLSVYVEMKTIDDESAYLVRMGPYKTKEEAQKWVESLLSIRLVHERPIVMNTSRQ